jgi:prepilin-type N-terminal cleavage/methylation domain-containing protein
MNKSQFKSSGQSGFSLAELSVAMTISLVVMAIASTLLASSFNVRNRENQRSLAIADAQRALNTMSREIANAGYGLSTNGIVTTDSGASSIRVRSDFRSDIAANGLGDGATNDLGEDVKFVFVNDANGRFIVRLNLQPTQSSALIANRIDGLAIYYFDRRVTYTIDNCGAGDCDISNIRNSAGAVQAQVTPDLAKYIVLSLRVTLPEVGTRGSEGYQPASATQLVSSVTLRNANLNTY